MEESKLENPEIGHALEEIGRLLAEDVGTDPDGTFLYAEFGDGWVAPSITKDTGERVISPEPSFDLMENLMNIWEMVVPDKRWTSMQYEIKDGRFDVKFGYDEFTEANVHDVDRLEMLVRQRYGDKPIEYIEPQSP